MTNYGNWRMLTAAVAAFAYGCGGQSAIDRGGSLVSEEGQIAFTRATKFTPPDFEYELYTINVDGSDERRLTSSPGLDAFPAWSPDGERIAFASDHDGNWELHVMNSDGTGRVTRLTDIPGHDHWPLTWSPDGGPTAFSSDGVEELGEI